MGDLGGQVAGLVGQRDSARIEVYVYEAAELLNGYDVKADGREVEVDKVVGVGGGVEAAVQAVGPSVVRAGNPAGGALPGQQLMGPVHAHVGEGPEGAGIVTDHDHRSVGDDRCRVIPRFADLFDVAHPLPGLGEDRLGLDVEPPGIGVGVG